MDFQEFEFFILDENAVSFPIATRDNISLEQATQLVANLKKALDAMVGEEAFSVGINITAFSHSSRSRKDK